MIRKIMLLACCALFFACGGCYDYSEPSELDIVAGIAIDAGAGGFYVTCEIVGAGEIKSRPTLTQGRGKTIPEAIDMCASPKKLYFGHMQTVVLAEETSRRGIAEIVDFLSKNGEMPLSANIVIARGTKAENMLKTDSTREETASFRLARIAKNAPQNATTAAVPFYEFVRTLNSKKTAFLPAVALDFTTSLGIFHGEELAGFIDGNVASAFLIASKNKNSGRLRAGSGTEIHDFDIVGTSVNSRKIKLTVALKDETHDSEILDEASRKKLEALCATQFQNDLNELKYILGEKYKTEGLVANAEFKVAVRLRGSGRTY